MSIQRKISIFLILLVVLSLSFFGIWRHFKSGGRGVDSTTEPGQPAAKDCRVDEISVVFSDPVMKGIIEPGTKVKILKNYYTCHPVEIGDVVYYRYSSQVSPVARVVRAGPEDQFKLVKDASGKYWNILINNETLTYEGKPYFFGNTNPPVLALYEKSFKGTLPQNVYLLFSNIPPGEVDSSNLGVMSTSDLVGKLDIPNQGSPPKHQTTPPPKS